MESCAQTGSTTHALPSKGQPRDSAHTPMPATAPKASAPTLETFTGNLPAAPVPALESAVIALEADDALRRWKKRRVGCAPSSTPLLPAQLPRFSLDPRRNLELTTTTDVSISTGPSAQALAQRNDAIARAAQSKQSGPASSPPSANSRSSVRKRKSSAVSAMSLAPRAPTKQQIREALGAPAPQPSDARQSSLRCAITLSSSVDRRKMPDGRHTLPYTGQCHIGSCPEKPHARNLCRKHYARAMRRLKKEPEIEIFH